MNDTQHDGAATATIITSEGDDAEVGWIDDGHQVTVTLEYGQFAFAVICPSDGADLDGEPWDELPVCRRVVDEDGKPQPDKSPAAECYLERLGKEFVSDEFFDGAAPVFEVASPFAVEYRFEGWDNEAVYVRPKPTAAVEPNALQTALNAATAMNGVHERTIARLRGHGAAEPVDTPVARPRETLVHLHFIAPGNEGRSTWIGTCEHRALLRNADGRRVLEVMIDVDAAPLPVEPPRGFRVGDLVQITARPSEGEHTPPGLRLIGRTGYVSEFDAESGHSIGVSGVEGWLGPVWCNSGEIRHVDAAQCPSCRGSGSHREPDPGDAEFESDRECMDCDGTGRVAAGSTGTVEPVGSVL
jgi:hypothetical protein